MASEVRTEAPKKRFAPKTPVHLDPPKDDPISAAELAKHDGMAHVAPRMTISLEQRSAIETDDEGSCVGTNADLGSYVAIKTTVFDVSGNKAYAPGGGYHGKENVCLHLSPLH